MTHILLLEPDAVLARLYAESLETAGYSVTTERSAEAAVHAADKRKPDIVVLELQLARHNGVEFLYEFRSYPEWQSIPAIVLCCVSPKDSFMADVRRPLNVVDCLYKPWLSLDGLVKSVSKATSKPLTTST